MIIMFMLTGMTMFALLLYGGSFIPPCHLHHDTSRYGVWRHSFHHDTSRYGVWRRRRCAEVCVCVLFVRVCMQCVCVMCGVCVVYAVCMFMQCVCVCV